MEVKVNPLEERMKRIPLYMMELHRLADAGYGTHAEICEKWSLSSVVHAIELLDIKDEVIASQTKE